MTDDDRDFDYADAGRWRAGVRITITGTDEDGEPVLRFDLKRWHPVAWSYVWHMLVEGMRELAEEDPRGAPPPLLAFAAVCAGWVDIIVLGRRLQ